MNKSVLFVDDESYVLNAVKRLFIDRDLNIITATDPFKAMDIVRSTKFSVIVSDQLMPGMTGIDFLEKTKEISPDSIRIMMTGHADFAVAMDAINKGEVYKFIMKPWDDTDLVITVLTAINRFNTVLTLKNADEDSLFSLARTIELKDPRTTGHCERVAKYSLTISNVIGFTEDQEKNLKYGSYLHDCGKIGIPEEILNFPGPLSEEQMEIVKKHPAWGAEVIRPVKLPKAVIEIILHHHEKYDGTGYPSGLSGEYIPLKARIVSVADAYDSLTSDRPFRTRMSPEKAVQIIRDARESHFDPRVADIFLGLLSEGI